MWGEGFYNQAQQFDAVLAYAVAGGSEVAWLYDLPGNDTLANYGLEEGDRDQIRAALPQILQVAGNDYLEASGRCARLSSGTRAFEAYDFSWVEAVTSKGGVDTKRVELTDYVLETAGPWIDL